MTNEEKHQLNQLAETVSAFSNRLYEGELINSYASLVVSDAQECVLAGNAEALVYFAAILLDLALRQQQGQHYHFDNTSILQSSNWSLVLKYTKPPWEEQL